MAQQQQNVHIAAPGFAGLNTQDSPVGMDISYAAVANNCVIDKFGRMSSRRGIQSFVVNPENAGGPGVNGFETMYIKGDVMVGACDNTTGTPTVFTVNTGGAWTAKASTGATTNDWDFCEALGYIVMVNPTATNPVHYINSTSAAMAPVADPLVVTTPDICLSAFGHTWIAQSGGNTIQWSGSYGTVDPTLGSFWTDPSGGNINVGDFWPEGGDGITALAAHNNYLVVFGERNILLYSLEGTNPTTGAPLFGPNYMQLVDSIVNIGCIARDSVVSTGTDYFFLDASGVRLLSRTIEQQSIPVGDVSRNVRDDLIADLRTVDVSSVRGVYYPEDALYLLFLPNANDAASSLVYCFDTRVQLDQGAHRVTRWRGKRILSAARSANSRELFFGYAGGASKYAGADDTSVLVGVDTPRPVRMEYWTHPQTFESPANFKFPKQVDVTLVGGATLTMYVKWRFDYNTKTFSNLIQRVSTVSAGQWGAYEGDPVGDDWDFGLWGDVGGSISTNRVKLWGQGRNIALGFISDVSTSQLSIQEFNLNALMGRSL